MNQNTSPQKKLTNSEEDSKRGKGQNTVRQQLTKWQ